MTSSLLSSKEQSMVPDMPELETVDFDMLVEDWVYHGEGNGSILFAYAGRDSRMQNQLLRLVKGEEISSDSVDSLAIAANNPADELLPEKEVQKRLAKTCESLMYTNKVIRSLVGDAYILPQRLVHVTASFIDSLNAAADQLRPAHRTHKRADPRQAFGVIIFDMVGSQVKGNDKVCIEIKPKWGFLPKSEYISEKTSVKRRVCRYCLHQYLKHGADKADSSFCPLDLYSGNRWRMEHALDCLASSPQNNLRVFVNGGIVGSADNGGLDTDIIPEWALLKQQIVDILLSDGILRKLAWLQSRLDHLDIEGVYPRYKRAIENGVLDGSQPRIKDWLHACSAFNMRQEDAQPSANSSLDAVDDRQAVLEFVLSATLKDISILIQIDSWPKSASTGMTCNSDNEKNNLPNYKIAVIDTDAKKLAKLPEYLEKDQKIVEYYLQCGPDPFDQKICTE
ncbi:hypothetical protein J3B02_002074 [Coemansia erecta]|uniref:Inositol-pentakisphosphate 2-kinase n=1 Tax=Coemansia asiatica TaxID=1052880 RepID=A0A9W7XKS7_9FUNG|nr:hypothetical protein LPJ64_001738 [Coemansia asiatica]KAJ2855609.1 hypothetical protein J3B02_002074 [Coemansia erecta]